MELNKSKESFTYESGLKIKKSDSRHPDFVRKKKQEALTWHVSEMQDHACKRYANDP